MWWNKIINWFSELGERNRCIKEFNESAKNAFIANIVPVYLKADISRGNRNFRHSFSNFFFSGFRIKTMSGRYMSPAEVEALGCAIISNQELTRRLVTLGFDTLEIYNPQGEKIKEWQLSTLLQLQ